MDIRFQDVTFLANKPYQITTGIIERAQILVHNFCGNMNTCETSNGDTINHNFTKFCSINAEYGQTSVAGLCPS